MLVVVIGKTCTGKTSLRLELQKEGYFTIEASEYFQRSQEKNALGFNSQHLPLSIFTADEIIKECGEKLEHAVLTGLRTVEEYEYFCKYISMVYLIAISCDNKECYKRAKIRKREHIGSYEWFVAKKINSDNALGLDNLMLKADTVLKNQGISLNTFLQNGKELIRQYI